MENEIELKIMLSPNNIPVISEWLANQTLLHHEQETLGNTYYDSEHRYFEQYQMGLRIRTKNNRHQLTLKMKGDIVGGLHIRPEYNLDLPDNIPDFKRLVNHYNLTFEDNSILQLPLFATFSTDFIRQKYLIQFQDSHIEVALDQGMIKNPEGQEAICEIEFELKAGNLADLFDFLTEMPTREKMWLSSLSKAQRGYLIGNDQKIAKAIAKLTACSIENLTEINQYQLAQQLADFIRLSPTPALIEKYQQVTQQQLADPVYLTSQAYLTQNIALLKKFYSQ